MNGKQLDDHLARHVITMPYRPVIRVQAKPDDRQSVRGWLQPEKVGASARGGRAVAIVAELGPASGWRLATYGYEVRPAGSRNAWDGSWTGRSVQRVHRVQCVRSGVLWVQLARLVLAAVFLVMNRSSVRFRQAALFLAVQWCLSI